MKKQILTLLGVWAIIMVSPAQENLDFARLQHLLEVKQKISKKVWPDFGKKQIHGPMLYFTRSGQYLVNPNAKSRKKLNSSPMENISLPQGLKADFITSEIDSTNFHMYVSYEGEDKSSVCYQQNVGYFSDLSITKKFVPDVTDTEEWMCMVIHEIFHLYQRSFKELHKIQGQLESEFTRDTLMHFYGNLDWYKESVKNENQLLLNALKSTSKEQSLAILSEYFERKENRWQRIEEEYGLKFGPLENMIEKLEGGGRFIEYQTKLQLKSYPYNEELASIDPAYKKDKFKEYSVERDEWMYQLWGPYFYATGFSLYRLFDKLEIDYQASIYQENTFIKDYFFPVEKEN